MTGRELFVALTRWVGLLVVLYGIYATGYYAIREAMPDLPATTPSTMGLVIGGVYVLLGLLLMFGAELLARLTYGRERAN